MCIMRMCVYRSFDFEGLCTALVGGVCVYVWGWGGGGISKGANSLVDRNCNGLKVEPLAAVMQVEPHKPHQSQQRYNEAEAANTTTPAPMRLLLPGQRQAQLGRQHAECQAGSVGQARGAGTASRSR